MSVLDALACRSADRSGGRGSADRGCRRVRPDRAAVMICPTWTPPRSPPPPPLRHPRSRSSAPSSRPRRCATRGRRRCARPLPLDGAKTTSAAEALGLWTVGDLLEHLPRDRREARAIAELEPEDTATIVVEVRRIASRPVRRRGMRPLVEATVADDSGTLNVTFFNQPWLVERYPAGTRVMLHGRSEGRGRFASRPTRGPATRSRRRRDRRALSGDRGPDLDPDPRARARASRRVRGRRRAAAGLGAGARAAARPRGGADRGALRRHRTPDRGGAAAGWRSTSCCSRSCAPAPAPASARRSSKAPVSTGERELTARWLARHAAVLADGRPDAGARGDRRGSGADRADAAAADGRGRLRQDRGRAVRAAARGRARATRGADGADRDARRAALRHDPDAAARGRRCRRTAHRIDARRPARGAAAPASRPGSCR